MSLDISLHETVKCPYCKATVDTRKELYTGNITHNLNIMAKEAGIYKELWCPKETGIDYAKELIAPLENGLKVMREDPKYFEQFNPKNGWGCYDGLVKSVVSYLNACKEFPESRVIISK